MSLSLPEYSTIEAILAVLSIWIEWNSLYTTVIHEHTLIPHGRLALKCNELLITAIRP
jgi:hypothetical protein